MEKMEDDANELQGAKIKKTIKKCRALGYRVQE